MVGYDGIVGLRLKRQAECERNESRRQATWALRKREKNKLFGDGWIIDERTGTAAHICQDRELVNLRPFCTSPGLLKPSNEIERAKDWFVHSRYQLNPPPRRALGAPLFEEASRAGEEGRRVQVSPLHRKPITQPLTESSAPFEVTEM